jgi:hypothetical protein
MGAEEPGTPLGAVAVAVQQLAGAMVQDRLQFLAVVQGDRRVQAPFVLVRPVDLADLLWKASSPARACSSATLNSVE